MLNDLTFDDGEAKPAATQFDDNENYLIAKWKMITSFLERVCAKCIYIIYQRVKRETVTSLASIIFFLGLLVKWWFFFCFFSSVRAAERRWLLFAHFSGPTMWREINNICTVCCVLFVCKTFSLWNHTPWFGRPISHTFCFWYICWNENCSLIRQQATTSTRTSFNFHKFECV